MSARRTLREMLREVDEIPVEHGRSYHLRVQLVSGDDERVEANLGELTLDQLQKLSRGPKAQVRTALLDVAGELLTSEEVGALPELTPAAVAEAIGDHFLTLAADNGRDGYAKGRRDTEKDIAAGLLNGQEYQDWSKGEPGAGPLLSALRQHYSTLLTGQSRAAYGSGYRAAQAGAPAPPEPIRITGGAKIANSRFQSNITTASASNAFDLGQLAGAGYVWSQVSDEALNTETVEQVADKVKRIVSRARWEGSNEAAVSVARQLYGSRGAHVANAADLVALVRSEQGERVDPFSGPGEPDPSAKRAEQVRADTLRAVASWLAQNWGVRLDSNPEALTTPEALGARVTTAMDQRVAQQVQDTIAPARLGGARWIYQEITGREYDVVALPGTGSGNKILAVAQALREHIGQLLRDAAAEHPPLRVGVGRAERVRYRTEGALSVYRWFTGGQELEHTAEYRDNPNKVAAVVHALRAHVDAERADLRPDLDVLQELHNHLHGPDDTGEHWDILPVDTTVTSYAAGLRVLTRRGASCPE